MKNQQIMKKLIVLVTAIVCSVHSSSAQSNEQSIGADMIVFNAKIATGSLTKPEASALAVKRGKIYAVGTDDEIMGLKGESTNIIDENVAVFDVPKYIFHQFLANIRGAS